MTAQKIISILSYSAPIFSSFICSLMLLTFYFQSPKGEYRRVIGWDLPAMSGALLCWVGIMLNAIDIESFVSYHSVGYFIFPLDTVLLYRVVYLLTNRSVKRKFPLWHYVIPILMGLIMAIWSAQVPFETRVGIIEKGSIPGMPVFSLLYTSYSAIFFIYTAVYAALSLYRIRQYRKKVVDYSADERSSVRWLYMVFMLIGMSLPASAAAYYFDNLIASPLTIITGFLFVFQHILTTYNLISGNYVVIELPIEKGNISTVKIDRESFERYTYEQKPYLDPALRITDICIAVGVNRTYLSAFINREYGMNFATYINRCRMEELDRMRDSPQSNQKSGLNLILDAGFGSYRNYLRVKKRLEEQSTILPE